LLSHLSPGSCSSPSLPALYITYLNSSFDHLLHEIASSQQLWPTWYPQILKMTTHSNTPVPLSNDGLRYSTNGLVTLKYLSVTDLSCIDTTSIQELYQALTQSVGLTQHLLANPWLIAITMEVDHDYFRQ
jgi:hypothetical protein